MKNLKQDKLPEEVVLKKPLHGYKDKRSEWGKLRVIRFLYIIAILFFGIGSMGFAFKLFSGEGNFIQLGISFISLFFFINLFVKISEKMKPLEQEIKTKKAFKRENKIIIRIVLFLILFIMVTILFFTLR
jgi:hypothetical protein